MAMFMRFAGLAVLFLLVCAAWLLPGLVILDFGCFIHRTLARWC